MTREKTKFVARTAGRCAISWATWVDVVAVSRPGALGWALILAVVFGPTWAWAVPAPDVQMLFGLGPGGEALTPLTAAQLAKAEQALPNHFYVFDSAGDTRKVDQSEFDLYADTMPYKNAGTYASSMGTCFGLSMKTMRWYQALRQERMIAGAPSGHSRAGLHSPVRRATQMLPLREYVQGGEANALEVLKDAIELQETDLGIGERPTFASLYEDYIRPDLEDEASGATILGLTFRDSLGRGLVTHAVLVVGLEEGAAVSQGVATTKGALPSPGGHRVPAVRVDLWDSNAPLQTEGEVDGYRRTTHLIYFPNSGSFSLPRGDWYDRYEDTVLKKLRVYHQGDPIALAQFERRDRDDLLWQESPTFLPEGVLVTKQANEFRVGTTRWTRAKVEGNDPKGRIRSTVRLESSAKLVALGHRGSSGFRPPGEGRSDWESAAAIQAAIMEAEVDQAVDEYVLETFHVRDPSKTIHDRTVR